MIGRNQRGDTLIEVTVALGILGFTLIGAFLVSNKAFTTGQVAKERSQMIAAAQTQAEALMSFRNSYDWTTFTSNTLAGKPAGFLRSLSAGDCDLSTPAVDRCFHMETQTVGGRQQWAPVAGAVSDSGLPPGNSVWITSETAYQDVYNFKIVYQVLPIGGGPMNQSTIFLRLVNLDGIRR